MVRSLSSERNRTTEITVRIGVGGERRWTKFEKNGDRQYRGSSYDGGVISTPLSTM